MGIRSLLRRVAKPAAMVGIVGMLSLSLVVSTPSNAQALAAPPISPPVIAGAIRTIAPAATVALNVASVTPWGFAIRSVVSLGMLAFSTSDIWMPYVTGTFGNAKQDAPNVPQTGAQGINQSMVLSNPYIQGDTASSFFTYQNQPPGGGFFSYTVAMRYECDWAQAGFANTVFNTYRTGSNVTFPFGGYNMSATCKATQGATQLTGVPVAAEWGLAGTGSFVTYDPASHRGSGPRNYLSVGTWGKDAFNPRGADVQYTVSNECIDAAGNVSTISATTAGDVGALKMPSCEAAGKGHGTGKTSITALAPGTTVPQPVWDSPRAPSDPATPLCDAARATGGCTLSIELDGSPCVTSNVECQNWAEIQKNDPNNTRLKCRFGPYTLTMSQCAMLEKAYQGAGAPATDANVDGDPGTGSWVDPNGNPIPLPVAPVPGAVPGGPAAGPVPGATPEQSQCFPQGWAMLNPIEWVMKPVGCALTAAFQPKKDLQTRITGMQGKFSNKVPVSWFGVGVQGVGAGACPTNWAVEFKGQSYSLICGTQADTIIRGFRPVLSAMLVMAMLWPLIRSLFYAAIPVFKVNPS